MNPPAKLAPVDARRLAAVRFFAQTWSLGWDADYVERAMQGFNRFSPEVLEAAVTALCRTGGQRPWNPLGALLDECDAEDARRTKRIAAPKRVVPTILGASYAEVLPYARSESEPFTHADLLRIRDEIEAKRGEKPAAKPRWRPS